MCPATPVRPELCSLRAQQNPQAGVAKHSTGSRGRQPPLGWQWVGWRDQENGVGFSGLEGGMKVSTCAGGCRRGCPSKGVPEPAKSSICSLSFSLGFFETRSVTEPRGLLDWAPSFSSPHAPPPLFTSGTEDPNSGPQVYTAGTSTCLCHLPVLCGAFKVRKNFFP